MPRSDGRTQATLEWYAAQVAEVMELPHIPYELEWYTQADDEGNGVPVRALYLCRRGLCRCPYVFFSTGPRLGFLR